MGKPQSKEENESGQQLFSIIENQNTHKELIKIMLLNYQF